MRLEPQISPLQISPRGIKTLSEATTPGSTLEVATQATGTTPEVAAPGSGVTPEAEPHQKQGSHQKQPR